MNDTFKFRYALFDEQKSKVRKSFESDEKERKKNSLGEGLISNFPFPLNVVLVSLSRHRSPTEALSKQ